MPEKTMEELRILLNNCLEIAKPRAGCSPESIIAFATAAKVLLEVIAKIESENGGQQ